MQTSLGVRAFTSAQPITKASSRQWAGAAHVARHHSAAAGLPQAQGGLKPLARRPRIVVGTATLERGGGHATAADGPVLVAVEVPNCQLAFGEHLRVVGSCAELGSWDAAAAPALEWSEGDCWAGELALPPGEHAFKLVVVRQDGSQQWEEGGDRSLLVPAVAAAAAPVGLPALRATCRFGNTACIDVEESSGSEADEPLPQAEERVSVADSLLFAAEAAAVQVQEWASNLNGSSAAATAQPPEAPAAAAELEAAAGMPLAAIEQALAGAGSLSTSDEEDAQQRELTADQLAEAWRGSRAGKAASAAPTPAQTAAVVAQPAAQAVAPASGLVLTVLLPACAAILYTSAVALDFIPAPTGLSFDLPALPSTLPAGLELPAGADLREWGASAAEALAAFRRSTAEAFTAWHADAGASLAPLRAQSAEALSAALSGLQAGSADTLGAFQRSAADVASNLAANTASLSAAVQERSAEALSAAQASSAEALAAAQATSADAAASVKQAAAGLKVPALDLLTLPRLQ